MKRIYKVLLLLLALSLLAGALIVASSATEPSGAFEYVVGGVTEIAEQGTDLATVIAEADNGSTIKLLAPYSETAETSVADITKNLTIDLAGNTLTMSNVSYPGLIHIKQSATLTVKGGSVVCMSSTSATGGRAAFRLYAGATLNLIDVKSYTGSLAYSYDGVDCSVNIQGGEHYGVAQSQEGYGALLETRANATVTAENAFFGIINASERLISSLSYKQASGTKSTKYLFVNCDIARFGSSGTLLGNVNSFTSITFNNCRIFGTLQPFSPPSGDTGASAAGAGLITLVGRNHLSDSSFIGSYATLDGGESCEEESSTESYTLSYPSGSLAGNSFAVSEKELSLSFSYAVEKEEYDLYAYTAKDGTAAVATSRVSLATVLSLAKTGSTVELLADALLRLDGDLEINEDFVIDLNQHVLGVTGAGCVMVGARLELRDGYLLSDKDVATFEIEDGAELDIMNAYTSGGTVAELCADGASLRVVGSYLSASGAVCIANGGTVSVVGGGVLADTLVLSASDTTEITIDGTKLHTDVRPEHGRVIIDSGTLVMEGFGVVGNPAEGVMAIEPRETATSVACIRRLGSIAEGDLSYESLSVPCNATVEYVGPDSEYYHAVRWFDTDGNLVKSDYVYDGEEATPPDAVSAPNGWVGTRLDGWSRTAGGEVADDLTVVEPSDFYATTSETVADIRVAKTNLSLTGAVSVNLFLPATTPAGITLVGVYGEGGKIVGESCMFGKTEYMRYPIGTVGAAALSSAKTATVRFEYLGTEYSETFSISPLRYAEVVLADSELADTGASLYGEAGHALVAEMIRYSNNIHKFMNSGVGNGAFEALLDKYGELCATLPSGNDFNAVQSTAAGVADYVSYITFEVSSFEPRYKIAFKEGSGVVGVELQMDGWLCDSAEGAVNFGNVVYQNDPSVTEYYADSSIKTTYTSGISIYNLDKPVTVVLTLSGGSTVSGEYSLEKYYNFMSGDDGASTLCREFIKSLRAYGAAAAAYRFPLGKITEGESVGFWDCSHSSATAKASSARYCPDCKTYLVYYGDFGAVGDGVTDDFVAIASAHKYANKSPTLRKVVAGKGTSGKGEFYMGEDYASYVSVTGAGGDIVVSTDVDWSGAHIIIDDSGIEPTELMPDGTNLKRSRPVFQCWVSGYSALSTSTYFPEGIKAGASRLNYAPGVPVLLRLVDNSSRQWIRVGPNANNGEVVEEHILIDEFGNVSSTTPIQYDYPASSLAASRLGISEMPVTISGLNDEGEIDCRVTTVANCGAQTSYISYSRNIFVQRSNVTVSGIDHRLDITETQQSLPYNGFISFARGFGGKVTDCKLDAHEQRFDSSGVLLGSYELSGTGHVNLSFIRCTEDFFEADGSLKFKGFMGTNNCRNILVDDCFIGSFDAHTAAHNVTIRNSTLKHANYIGGGNAKLENVTFYVDARTCALVLREDYGSIWRGDFILKNVELRYSKSVSYVRLFEAGYANQTLGYYGSGAEFTTAMPTNVYIDGLTLTKYAYSISESGERKEWQLGCNLVPVYLFYDLESLSDTKGSNNYYKPCENVYITNTDTDIVVPTGSAFSDMNVYIDNVLQ